MKYNYTIFDGTLGSGQPWPSHEDIEIESESVDSALGAIEKIARQVTKKSSEYSKGDILTLVIWTNYGTIDKLKTISI